MATRIDSIEATLEGDSSGFQKSINDATKSLQASIDDFEQFTAALAVTAKQGSITAAELKALQRASDSLKLKQLELQVDTGSLPRFEGGVSKAKGSVDALGRSVEEFEREIARLEARDPAGSLRDLGVQAKAATDKLGILAAGLAGVGFLAAKSASDFEQTGSLIERVFEDGARDAESFAAVTADELGLSIQETRQGLVSLGAQLKNSLGDTSAATAQSQALVKLAADISAAQNIPFADTLERIQSGLRGEADAVEKLNVFLSVSALKQEALALGITKSVEKMSEQEKVALRLSAIHRQTADLVGAAAAEAETFAGQTARLDAELKNLAVDMGQALLPAALSVVSTLRDAVRFFADLSDETKKTVVSVAATTAALAAAAFAAGQVGAAVAALSKLLAAASAAAAVFGISLTGALTVAAAAAISFTAAYSATTVVLDLLGFRTVPENVSVFGELADAVGMVAEGGTSLVRVLLNVVSAGLATAATLAVIASLGAVDLRDEVDRLNETFQGMLDELDQADAVAEQMDRLGLAIDEGLLKPTESAADAVSGLGSILEGTDAPLAGTAEAVKFLKDKQKEAEKAAREHTKALDDQAKAFERLSEFAKGLQDQLRQQEFAVSGFGSAVVERERRREEAAARGAEVEGVGAELGLAAVADDIDRLFVRELGEALAKVPLGQFTEAMAEADELLGAFGLSLTDLVAATPELQQQADDLNSGLRELASETTETAEAMKDAQAELRASVVEGLVTTATGGAGLAPAGGAIGGAVGAAVDVALGGASGGLGTTIGTILGTVLGDALQELVDILGVVTPLMDGLAVAMDGLTPILRSLRIFFQAIGQVLVALRPVIEELSIAFAAVFIEPLVRAIQVMVPFVIVVIQVVAALLQFVTLLSVVGDFVVTNFINPIVQSVQNFANGIADVVNAFIDVVRAIPGFENFGAKLETVDLTESLGFFEDLTGTQDILDDYIAGLEEASSGSERLGEETGAAAEGMRGLNEELRNAASDFKVAAVRFASAEAVAAPGASAAPGVAVGGLTVVIENATIEANDPQDVLRNLERIGRRANIRRRGTNAGRPDYNGRWEG